MCADCYSLRASERFASSELHLWGGFPSQLPRPPRPLRPSSAGHERRESQSKLPWLVAAERSRFFPKVMAPFVDKPGIPPRTVQIERYFASPPPHCFVTRAFLKTRLCTQQIFNINDHAYETCCEMCVSITLGIIYDLDSTDCFRGMHTITMQSSFRVSQFAPSMLDLSTQIVFSLTNLYN
jgi:hypothetical protein